MATYQDVLKVNTLNISGPLLRRLILAKEQVDPNSEMGPIIDQILTEVEDKVDDFQAILNWDRGVVGRFQRIEKHIDNLFQDKNIATESDSVMELKELLDMLQSYQLEYLPKARTRHHDKRANPPKGGTKPHEKASDLPQEAPITEVETNRSYQENKILMDLNFMQSWDPKMKSCLYSLVLFPENTELKKRLLIYWWIGLGLEPSAGDTSRTERCELFFSDLVNMGVLVPIYNKEHNKAIDRCIIEPTIHKLLISDCGLVWSAKSAEGTWQLYDGDNMKVLLNLDQRYLNPKEIISNNHHLLVVELGMWQRTEFINRVKRTNHIEVNETDFLSRLGENVTYLSLRGISGIEELHGSIGKLENLMILDLSDCIQLKKLPQKPRSISKQKLVRWALPQASWFKKLMVLDISGCYMLDPNMPKWICEISNLEVLKGFLVESVGNKNQSCRLRDLSKLNKLRKISIRIAYSGTVDLSVLQPLDRLLVLTIIWEGYKANNHILASSLPENIEKLDIRCYPKSEASELLNPAKLKKFKKLYIRGGKLTEIPCNGHWEVEILRLRYLRNLECPTWEELKSSFKNLRYVEYVECPRLRGFPKERSSWSMESDEPFQRDDASDTSNES